MQTAPTVATSSCDSREQGSAFFSSLVPSEPPCLLPAKRHIQTTRPSRLSLGSSAYFAAAACLDATPPPLAYAGGARATGPKADPPSLGFSTVLTAYLDLHIKPLFAAHLLV